MSRPFQNPKTLNEEQRLALLDSCFDIKPIFETAKKFGFKTKYGFQWYLRRDPEFWAEIKQARIDACEFIEDEFLQIHQKYDFKMAKHVIEIYTRALAWRVPSKYSTRIDMNINQTVSIQHNLVSANDRIKEVIQSAMPLAISQQTEREAQPTLEIKQIEVTDSDKD